MSIGEVSELSTKIVLLCSSTPSWGSLRRA